MGKLLKKLRKSKKVHKHEDNLEWLDLDDEEEYYEDDEEDIEDEEEYYEDDEEDIEDEEEYYEDDEEDIEDEEEYYEDDEEDIEDEEEYYEDDEYDDEYESVPPRGIKKLIYKFSQMSTVDHIVAFTGLIVLVVAGVTGTLYLNARSTQNQVETFAEVGIGMEEISIIGENGMVAIADAYASKVMAADEMEDQEEQGDAYENAEVDGKTAIALNLTSIQKDLKIKFVNKKSGKLIPSIEFEVKIEKPSGDTYNLKDDDKDGIIYQTGITPGRYQITIVSPVTHDEYSIPTDTQAITVRDTIEYKKVDVSDEVKTEAQVNVAVEDTKVNETVVESTNTDTVEWVESTKTVISGTEKTEESYEKVDKSKKITDPAIKASLGFRLLTEVTEPTPGSETTPTPVVTEPTPTPEPTAEPGSEPGTGATPAPEPGTDPTPVKSPEKTTEPTLAPTQTPSPTLAATPSTKPTATPTATPTASPSPSPTASPSPTPTTKPTATPSPTANKAKTDTTSNLKDNDGNQLYVKDGDKYREAKYADYYKYDTFYRKNSKVTGEYRYTGWQTIDGATYFFDKNGNKVTGEQVIQGAKYNFNSDGALNNSSGHMGIDVSKWNGSIDWNAVRNSGVSYVIIRCGYRGSTTGALIEDPTFRSNIQGASKAGLKVGVYFFTQAVNEVEAVEEASMVLGLIKGYNISYPVFLDVESSGGRADSINSATRTAVCKAFCQTIQNSGYKAGIYANKTWFNSYMETPSLTGYKIWLAQYAAAPSYTRTKYDMWQYSSKGSVGGIKGNVDMNISYMGY